MFDIGFQEMILIGLLALIVLGPKRLPEAARSAGRWVGKARAFINNVKRDLNRELQSQDLAEFRRLQEELAGARRMLQDSTGNMVDEIKTSLDEAKAGTGDYLLKAHPDSGAAPAPKAKRKPSGKAAAVKKTGARTKAKTKPTRTSGAGRKTPSTPARKGKPAAGTRKAGGSTRKATARRKPRAGAKRSAR